MATSLTNRDFWSDTDFKLVELGYLWIINEFSSYTRNASMSSSLFPTPGNKNIQWRMCLNQSADYVSLYLCPYITVCCEVLAKYKLCLLNAEGEKVYVQEIGILQSFENGIYKGFDQYIPQCMLKTQKNDFLPGDSLKIQCKLHVAVRDVDFMEPECKLSEQFGNILDNGEFSDVTLVAGGHELPAHKAILAARSDVFAAMFKHEMEESKLDRVDIIDINPEVLKEMLRFMYTGKAPNLLQMVTELLAAADKYALEKLKVMCVRALCAQISFATAAETFIVADLYSAHKLKAIAMKFINDHAQEVLKTQGWQDVITTHQDLIAEEFPALAVPNSAIVEK